MRNTDIAYLAGYIDADGTIGYHFKNKETFQPSMSIVSTKHAILEDLQRLFGGYLQVSTVGGGNKRTRYALRFRKEEMKEMLPQVLPYLKIKFMQGMLVLKALTQPLDIETKHKLASEMKELNKRGTT